MEGSVDFKTKLKSHRSLRELETQRISNSQRCVMFNECWLSCSHFPMLLYEMYKLPVLFNPSQHLLCTRACVLAGWLNHGADGYRIPRSRFVVFVVDPRATAEGLEPRWSLRLQRADTSRRASQCPAPSGKPESSEQSCGEQPPGVPPAAGRGPAPFQGPPRRAAPSRPSSALAEDGGRPARSALTKNGGTHSPPASGGSGSGVRGEAEAEVMSAPVPAAAGQEEAAAGRPGRAPPATRQLPGNGGAIRGSVRDWGRAGPRAAPTSGAPRSAGSRADPSAAGGLRSTSPRGGGGRACRGGWGAPRACPRLAEGTALTSRPLGGGEPPFGRRRSAPKGFKPPPWASWAAAGACGKFSSVARPA